MKWVIEVEGGPAFPVNAAHACRTAASKWSDGPVREALLRLSAAAVAARTDDKPSSDDYADEPQGM